MSPQKQNQAYFASIVGLVGNIFLFLAKFSVGLMTNSLAIISEAVNSFTDIFASSTIAWSVKIGKKKADKDHQFGHYRAEPIAGLVVAIFTGIVAFEVFKEGVMRLLDDNKVKFSIFAVGVLVMTIIVKLAMYFYLKRVATQTKSCALQATATDCRNDVLSSSIALMGIAGVYFNLPVFDSLAAMVISVWIGYSGYKIGEENIDYLMGKAPQEEILNFARKAALGVKGVKNIHDFLAHYVGVYIHLEAHIEVDKNLTTQESHNIGKKVQRAILKHKSISQVFVHIDPV